MNIKAWVNGQEVFSNKENIVEKIKDLINTYNKVNIDISGKDTRIESPHELSEKEYLVTVYRNNDIINKISYETSLDFMVSAIVSYPRFGQIYDFQIEGLN